MVLCVANHHRMRNLTCLRMQERGAPAGDVRPDLVGDARINWGYVWWSGVERPVFAIGPLLHRHHLMLQFRGQPGF